MDHRLSRTYRRVDGEANADAGAIDLHRLDPANVRNTGAVRRDVGREGRLRLARPILGVDPTHFRPFEVADALPIPDAC